MTNNVTLPAQGTGTNQPIVETIDTTGSNGPQREVISLGSIGKPGSSADITIGQKTKAASIPVAISSDQDDATPTALTNSTVAIGNTAVVVATGPIKGGYVTNPANAARQGISTAEPLYLDMVNSPGSTDPVAFGTTFALDPGQNFDLPALAAGVQVRVNAATAGHQFSGVKW